MVWEVVRGDGAITDTNSCSLLYQGHWLLQFNNKIGMNDMGIFLYDKIGWCSMWTQPGQSLSSMLPLHLLRQVSSRWPHTACVNVVTIQPTNLYANTPSHSHDDQTRPHKKHKQHDKHYHHGGGATHPSSGVDLMNPCRWSWRGRRPCTYFFEAAIAQL